MEGPRVSGPWLVVWGGNAIVLNCPALYTHRFRPFLPCGTMFPRIFNFSSDVASRGPSDMITMKEMLRSCGLVSTGSPSMHMRYSLSLIA